MQQDALEMQEKIVKLQEKTAEEEKQLDEVGVKECAVADQILDTKKEEIQIKTYIKAKKDYEA